MRRLSSVLLILAMVMAMAAPADAATRLTAAFTLTGAQGKFVVSNPGATPVTGWSIQFDLPAGVTVGNAQNVTTTQSGTRVKLTPAFYINTVRANGNTNHTVPRSPSVPLLDRRTAGSTT